ncbi:hypothetical protein VUR80DRAFT_1278 [Thermomyces stellatus]
MTQPWAGAYGASARPMSADGLEPVPQPHTYPEPVASPGEAKDAREAMPHQDLAWTTEPHAASPQKTILGLRRTTFSLIALLILVIIAAAVGGGVGGSVAVRKAYDRGVADGATAKSDPDSDTATKTSDRVAPPPTEGVLELDCPDLTSTTHDVVLGVKIYRFEAHCGINHPGEDITVLPAYSYMDCATACAAFNEHDPEEDRRCIAAHFSAKIQTDKGGNCWLKRKLGDLDPDPDEDLHVELELQNK